MITPEDVLLLWFVALGLLALLAGGLALDVHRITRYTGRHVRLAGAHRLDANGGWWT